MKDPVQYSLDMQNSVKKAIDEKYSTIEGRRNILKVDNIHFDPLPAPDDYARQKDILYKRGTEGVNMYGDMELVEKSTGKSIGKSKKVKLGFIPSITNRHSIILNGKEYSASTQMRLRPAIYTKLDRLGVAQADFNLAKGKNMELTYQPSKGLFNVSVNKSNVPLYSILKGVYKTPDAELAKAFGTEMHLDQVAKTAGKMDTHLGQLYDLLHKGNRLPKPTTTEGMAMAIKEKFDKTIMDPETNKKTLGVGYTKVEAAPLIHAAKEVMSIYKGEADPTWKDNLAFKSMHSAEDFLYEKFTKLAPQTINKLKFKIDAATNPSRTGLRSAFDSHLRGFFVDSDIVNYPMQVNPYEFMENAHKITSLGEGGISSTESLPKDARNLHPSHMGFIDPVRTPDNMRAGIDLRLGMLTTKKGDKLVSTWKNAKTGKYENIDHVSAFDKYVCVENEPTQPGNMVRAFHKGKITEVPKSKLDFLIPSEAIYTVTTGALPFLANSQGQRTAMGAKMTTQALSLVDREPPLVDTSANKLITSVYHPKAKVDGKVTKISDSEIHIAGTDGKAITHFIPHEFPLNYHSYLHSTPTVKVGDTVKKGSIIAEHNYAKDGKMAIGINANVAYIPYKGYNFEDAVVVTQTGANKFSSNHIFQEELEIPDDSVLVDAAKYKAWYPNKYSPSQIANLNGSVVKKGATVVQGDPLILALKKKRANPEILLSGKAVDRISNPFGDISLAWDKNYPGRVKDVIAQPGFIKVIIEAVAPLQLGDKLCYDALTEVLTDKGWKYITDISIKDRIAQLVTGPSFKKQAVIWEEPRAIHVFPEGGRMVRRAGKDVDIFVTDKHDLFGFFDAGATEATKKKAIEVGRGYFSFIQIRQDKNNNFYLKKKKDINSVFVVEEDYDQPVYCLTTATGNLYVRRNGKERFCGNSGRYGNKGIVGLIIPDHEAPKTAEGHIPDVLLNPAGLNSRMNNGQVFETVLGKVLKAKGNKAEFYKNFNGKNTWEDINATAKAAGVKTEETYIDPTTGKKIPKILSGVQYIYKLSKQTEGNFAARAGGEYDIDMRPVRGGEEGSKAVGNLDLYAVLGYGHTKNILREMATYKAEYNPELWAAVLGGKPLPKPKSTFTWNKVETYLNGMGINVKREGNNLQVMPLTDKDVLARSKGEIKDAALVMEKPDPVTGLNFRPEKGGLFDQGLTGGLAGNHWTHIQLARPVVNSMYEKPIRSLLDIDQKTFKAVADGSAHMMVDGKQMRGAEAFQAALKKINVKADLQKYHHELAGAKTLDKKDSLIKKIKYLSALDSMKLHPVDAYVNNVIPIIPPKFRPIYPDEKGKTVVTDANRLYQEVVHFNKLLSDPLSQALGPNDPINLERYKGLHESVQKLQGLDPTAGDMAANKNRDPSGFLKVLVGTQPKMGFFQSKLLSRVQDLVGRATVAPNPKMGLDEVGIPKPMAWKLYGNFVAGEMVKNGFSIPRAKEELEKQTPLAHTMLVNEMAKRPVMLNRAPSLHKHSFVAFNPTIVEGKTIHMSTMAVKGFNMDFDGDSCYSSVFQRSQIVDTQGKFCYNSWHKETKETEVSYNNILSEKDNDQMPINNRVLYKNGLTLLKDFPRLEETKRTKENTDFYDVPEGVEVLVLGNDREYKWLKPESFSVHRGLTMVNVKTNRHRTVICSKDHSLVTLDKDLNIVKSEPKEQMLVPIRTKPVYEHSLDEVVLPVNNEGHKHILREKMPLNYDTGYLIGCIVGDGWISAGNHSSQFYLCFASTTKAMDARWEKIIQENIVAANGDKVHLSWVNNDHTYQGYDCESAKVTWSAAGMLGPLIKEWVGHKAQNKHFPDFFLESPIAFRKGLLAGLIDTDGAMDINASGKRKDKPQANLNITTTSERLAFEIVALGNTLGLSVGVTVGKTPAGGVCYTVFFSSDSVYRLKSMIVLSHPLKQANLLQARDVDVDREFYGPPTSVERVAELQKMVGAPRKFKKGTNIPVSDDPVKMANISARCSLYTTLNDIVKGKNGRSPFLTMGNCKSILALNLPELDKSPFWVRWKEWVLDENTHWENVVEITPVPDLTEAYDLTIPPDFTMVTESSWVVFDTATCHLPISNEAIAEARQMLPSNNLFHVLDKSLWHLPQQETIMGLNAISSPNQAKPIHTFNTVEDAKKAYENKQIAINDHIEIKKM
jgi:DNA-directed RNA polymerase beta subunit